AGIPQLADAVTWFGRSHLRLTFCSFGVWLVDSYLSAGESASAQSVLEDVFAASREGGYRHLEGIALRLRGQLLARTDPAAAARDVDSAIDILAHVGARNEYAKALVAQGDLRLTAGDAAKARGLFGRAVEIFQALGT